jgi:hypothetical protein
MRFAVAAIVVVTAACPRIDDVADAGLVACPKGDECTAPLVCRHAHGETDCVLPAELGDVCIADRVLSVHPCGAGLSCAECDSDDGDENGTCVVSPAAGAPCGPTGRGLSSCAVFPPCAGGLECACGSCAPAGEGGCPDGFICGDVCINGNATATGCVTTAPAEAGDVCNDCDSVGVVTRECAEGLTCSVQCGDDLRMCCG